MKYKIEVDYEGKEEASAIREGLMAFNTPFFGNKKGLPFAIILKDEKSVVKGGVLGWIRPGLKLLYIDTLWVAETARLQGFGTKLMAAAESEGRKHGCTHMQIETLPFQAEPFYKKLGFERIGTVAKLYGDHDAIFMRKKLR